MSAYRPNSYGKFGRVPDAPEPIERDCENCKHYQIAGITGRDHVPYYGCELWDCEFEEKEAENDD